MTVAQIIIVISGVVLFAAAGFALWRLAAGPTGLDRGVAADVLIAVVIAAVAAYSMWAGHALGLLVIFVLSLLGFTGAVGLARLITRAASNESLFASGQRDGSADLDDVAAQRGDA